MIAQPINLAKFYELTFRGAKALISTIPWDNIPGQNKLRKFFLRDNWQDDIVRISVSSSGAKGGVFFLEADTLDRQELDQTIGNPNKAWQIWKQLIADNLITPQGIKTAAGRAGTLPAQRLVYDGHKTKLVALLKQSNPKRQFVVKGTEEPGRTLFAEYVLSQVGQAKIPKSLVLEVDPTRPHNHQNPSEGMVLLQLLSDPNKRSPQVDAQTYANSYAFLDDGQGTANSRVSYLVIQKLIGGSTLPIINDVVGEIVDFLVEQNIRINEKSFLADADFQGTSKQAVAELVTELKGLGCLSLGGIVDPQYQTKLGGLTKLTTKQAAITRILKTASDTLQAHGLQFTKNDPHAQFDELDAFMQGAGDSPLKRAFDLLRARQTGYMQTVEAILDNPEAMYNVGRIVFADLPIGNGDRFENMNSGNFFFVNKTTTKVDKVNYPIGCIDNDAFMHTCLKRRNQPRPEGFNTLDEYVAGLLQDGTPELWGVDNAPPPGHVFASSAAVQQMMNVGRWFDTVFCVSILGFSMPKCVVKQLSAKYYQPNENAPYANSKKLPAWQQVKQQVQHGFCEALLDHQGIPLHQFRQVYTTLASQYGKGINFDFLAFEVRHRYLQEAKVDKSTWTVILPDFDTFNDLIVVDLESKIGDSSLSKTIQNALTSPEAIDVLQNAKVTYAQIAELLKMLSIRDQEALVPCPFGIVKDKWKNPVHFGVLPAETKKALVERWATLAPKYQKRMNAVICAILANFVKDYATESASARFSHVFILDTAAYAEAARIAMMFSRVKLYKDDGNQKSNRKLYLLEFKLDKYI